MSKWKMVVALLALAALAAWPIYAATSASVGQSTNGINQPDMVGGRIRNSPNTMTDIQFDADSNLYVTEANPASSFLIRQSNWLQTRLAVGNIDSTAVVSTLGANHLYLEILGTTDSLTCTAVFGITPRRHSNALSDSVSTFPWQRWSNIAGTAGAGGIAGAADTVGTRGTTAFAAKTTTGAEPDEIIYVVPSITRAGNPRGRSIELIDRNGAPLTAAYLSLRVRCLAVATWGACADTTAGGRSASIKINLVGTR